MLRAAHRVAGTLAGVLVVGLLAFAHPPAPVQVAIVVLAAWGMNVVMAWHYAVAAVFITTMTLQENLLMAGAQATPELLADRLLATTLGVGAALATLAIASRMTGARVRA